MSSAPTKEIEMKLPFVLSLSKDERQLLQARRAVLWCFDRLSTNGLF